MAQSIRYLLLLFHQYRQALLPTLTKKTNKSPQNELIVTFEEFMMRYQHDPKAPLHRGGQGLVYRGKDNLTGAEIAIKRAQVKPNNEKYSVLNEFRLGRGLVHPNLAKYYDSYRINTHTGTYDYGIMEFVGEGANLDDFLLTFPEEPVIQKVLIDILEALSYLHASRVIHRDLKPNNILVDRLHKSPTAKIIDFGVSKELRSDETSASAIVGTYEYMAPEQISPRRGQKMRPNVDIWAFGVITYRLFTGHMPFGSIEEGTPRDQISNRVLDAKIPTLIQQVPDPYRTIITSCLVKDPKERIQTASRIIKMLKPTKRRAGTSEQPGTLLNAKDRIELYYKQFREYLDNYSKPVKGMLVAALLLLLITMIAWLIS